MDPEVLSCDAFFEEAAPSPPTTSSKTSCTPLPEKPDQPVEYCHLLPGRPMSDAVLDLHCAFNFPQFSPCEQTLRTADTPSVTELGQLHLDLLQKKGPGQYGFAGISHHHVDVLPSPPSTVYLRNGVGDDFTSWLDQWLTDDPSGRQENPPVSSWSTLFLAPDLDEQSYCGSLNAQIADRLELDALLLDDGVWLSDLWWNAVAEVSLEYTPDGNPTPESGGEQQCCERGDQHCSWDSTNEVFEISRADFEASSRRKYYPQPPPKRLQSTRKGGQRSKVTLGRRRLKTPRPTTFRRPLSPRSKTKSIKYVRLEEITDEKGDRYKWNRRAGKKGSWENSKKESVDVMVLLRDSKARLQMKVRPGGAKLPVDMGWSHTDTCFEGEVQDVGRLRVSEDVMNEMCKDPQRKDRFQAI
ncbi:hypothetical protein F5883DRAFT_544307 [Diaporthe sp. PMI_573]|nr:hypothetical protein F5883DRAFT_544307 [Diaporthaceae sp. PMI_573]